jgi:hypothetical protein
LFTSPTHRHRHANDLNGDKRINIGDLYLVATHFGPYPTP